MKKFVLVVVWLYDTTIPLFLQLPGYANFFGALSISLCKSNKTNRLQHSLRAVPCPHVAIQHIGQVPCE